MTQKPSIDVTSFDLEQTFSALRGTIKPSLGIFATMPLASFAGLKIQSVVAHHSVVTMPGGWRTQNPFKSTYWAAQGMAAEMATGLIPAAYVRASPVPVRMILAGTHARFIKMCKGKSTFKHDAGDAVRQAMNETFETGNSVTCELTSLGYDSEGDVVSEWSFTWSFRARLNEVKTNQRGSRSLRFE